ncbi:MAG: MBL fold metallo-hydrolase [Synergistales bacterium]|nr:MBL fold metallo-hydrolase [Synergistales bacterium]
MSYLSEIKVTVVAEDSVHYGSDLLGQHGMSFFVEARNDNSVMRVLFDLGQNYQALKHNLTLLGISLQEIDAIILSHSHRDHTNGLVEVIRDIGKENLPVIAHPDIFKTTFLVEPVLKYAGIRGKRTQWMLENSGASLFLSSEPVQLMPGLTTSGEIPFSLTDKNRSLPIFMLDKGKVIPDPINEEIALIAGIQGKGLLILTGCGHPGIIKIIDKAVSLFPGEKVEVIMGGFHFAGLEKRKVQEIGEGLKKFAPSFILPGHCTGFEADLLLAEIFENSFKPVYSGTEIRVSEHAPTVIDQAKENK